MIGKLLSAVLLASLCASNTLAANVPSQKSMEKMQRQREAMGIYNFIKLYPETGEIEFTYGSPEHHRMSFADFAEFVRGRLADQTVTSSPAAFGYQIEYYGADGRAYLWYPGNEVTAVGTYVLRTSMEPVNMFGDRAGVVICFDYGPNSYNPSTGKAGEEECEAAYAFIAGIRGKRNGDVFNLSSGRVPFVMTKGNAPTWPDRKPLLDKKAPHN